VEEQMKRKCFSAMIAVAVLFAGCGGGGFEYNGLEWKVGPDRDMTWHEASQWVQGLGGSWRMPTPEELQGLWDAGIQSTGSSWGPFQNSGHFVWSGEISDSSSAWDFYFKEGYGDWSPQGTSSGTRAFAVRSPQ